MKEEVKHSEEGPLRAAGRRDGGDQTHTFNQAPE